MLRSFIHHPSPSSQTNSLLRPPEAALQRPSSSPPSNSSTESRSGKVPRLLLPPGDPFARAIVMGNSRTSCVVGREIDRVQEPKFHHPTTVPPEGGRSRFGQNNPPSNLTILLDQAQNSSVNRNDSQSLPLAALKGVQIHQETDAIASPRRQPVKSAMMDEADSASGPCLGSLGSSAPPSFLSSGHRRKRADSLSEPNKTRPHSPKMAKAHDPIVRRTMSCREIPSGPSTDSPYALIMFKKDILETSMRERFHALRQAELAHNWQKQRPNANIPGQNRYEEAHDFGKTNETDEMHRRNQSCKANSDVSTSSRSTGVRNANARELRTQRRAQHVEAVVEDLCGVVADLFVSESKLLDPVRYGVELSPTKHQPIDTAVRSSVRAFVSALPCRYVLGVDSPSEVLLHMRLMAAVRADHARAALHIHSVEEGVRSYECQQLRQEGTDSRAIRMTRLVTIACSDATGLLEYITKLLATGGSRVLDADVMLSRDGIALDRFVVEMSGQLRLDRLAYLVETFLKRVGKEDSSSKVPSSGTGPLYLQEPVSTNRKLPCDTSFEVQKEIETAVPLTRVLASMGNFPEGQKQAAAGLPILRKQRSMPTSGSNKKEAEQQRILPTSINVRPLENNQAGSQGGLAPDSEDPTRRRRQLLDRPACANLDAFRFSKTTDVPQGEVGTVSNPAIFAEDIQHRTVPLIPFDELKLIETLGTGRVSTIYRAAWQPRADKNPAGAMDYHAGVRMVALKVAIVNAQSGDTSHLEELKREADIAAQLQHPHVCQLVAVAADPECFCLAYEFCEGGSLLSLLMDSTRYYEYLPIALDIANGMAFLHSRNIIHRDLKPSNILLTRDHRAKISDFGMSIANTGQELTAETGTYRYMAPEVIRHESYSSSADVYSFGICLWQLLTREIPFANLTPIQAAYAVAQGYRPEIPHSPRPLQDIVVACWDHASHRRPSFTQIAMALADYARMAFSPATVGTQTLQIANEMLANVDRNPNMYVDYSTPNPLNGFPFTYSLGFCEMHRQYDDSSNIGLEIE